MTLSEELYEFPQLSDIETWLRRHPTTPQVESVEEIALSLLQLDLGPRKSRDQIKSEFNKVVKESFGELAVGKFLHQHAGKFVDKIEILGPAVNVMEFAVQIKDVYDQYQEGNSVKEIAESELVSALLKVFKSTMHTHPLGGIAIAEATERIYDRIQFGRKFTISKAEISQSLEELLNQMRTEGFNVDTIVHA